VPAPQQRLSVEQVAEHCRATTLVAGDGATTVGIELEWLTRVAGGRLSHAAAQHAIERLTPLPAGGRLTIEPGGQLELSTAPFVGTDAACSAAATDLLVLDTACAAEDVELVALGADPTRPPERVTTAPRYRAMEHYFDTFGRAGRTMMCNTAALQVNVGFGSAERQQAAWHLASALGPTLVACFANSPLGGGGPTGWQSSRLRAWWMLDPTRSAPVPTGPDPIDHWLRYALDARVMLIRVDDDDYRPITEPLPFGAWIARGHELGWPTIDDLEYHLTTLFPPVRPKGWLELRMFDALPTPFWHVATAVTVALLDDEEAADGATRAVDGTTGLWVDAAQLGLGHPGLAASGRRCFELALDALGRLGGDPGTVDVVAAYLDRWVARARCPADDRLDAWRRHGELWPQRVSPIPYADELDRSSVLP